MLPGLPAKSGLTGLSSISSVARKSASSEEACRDRRGSVSRLAASANDRWALYPGCHWRHRSHRCGGLQGKAGGAASAGPDLGRSSGPNGRRGLGEVKPNGLHLAYLDPFNLEHLPFSVIERLARFKNIDVVVHFSIMDLQRELELDFERDESRLEVFAPGWRFNIDPRTVSKQEARNQFVQYWLSLVNSLGFSCSRERPLMTNSNNGPLYRMMLLMRPPLAEKLWGDIAKPSQGKLF
jgi:hypothetical protein